ncbi:MAG: 30S ribosomal protein S3 [Firmicutes bacterium]|nr:30S ribosomal protein S3 [Bacillota bacterium]
MGQKVNPNGMRTGINKNWNSRWYFGCKKIASSLIEDYKLRNFIKKKISNTGVAKIEIERRGCKIFTLIHCAKPGMVIGRAGAGIDKLKSECEAFIKSSVMVSVLEVKKPDSDAQLISESVAQQLEKRISFRRAIKQAVGRAMKLVRGIKIKVSGRLGGIDIARQECCHEGSIPLQTIRADINYGFAEANTTYGKIGVKVWIYKGEIFKENSNKVTGGEQNVVAKEDQVQKST